MKKANFNSFFSRERKIIYFSIDTPKLTNDDFADINQKTEKLAATTWAKKALETLKGETELGKIKANLEKIKGIAAKDWGKEANIDDGAGGKKKMTFEDTSRYVANLQAALKLLYKANPDKYKDPGRIDGVFANVIDVNGKKAADLKNSKTAQALAVINEGNLGINDKAIDKVLDEINTVFESVPPVLENPPTEALNQTVAPTEAPSSSGNSEESSEETSSEESSDESGGSSSDEESGEESSGTDDDADSDLNKPKKETTDDLDVMP